MLSVNSKKEKSICHVQITQINMMPRVWRGAISAKKAGYDVTVIGVGNNQICNGIQYIGFEVEPNRIKRILVTSKNMVRYAAKSDASIVELHSPEFLLYYGILRRAGKKIIFNTHEIYAMQIKIKEYIPKPLRSILSAVYRCIEKAVAKRIDGILYPCTVKGKNVYEDYKCKTIKIENYSEPHEMNGIRAIEKRTAIYAGSLSEERGISTLVDVFNELDGKLYLAGKFDSEECERTIMEKANHNKVVFLGTLSREELFDYYRRISVGLSLVKKCGQYNMIDNLSTKIYEYMQCGIPVVATDMDYAVAVNSQIQFGLLVNPDDKEEIKSAIERLFSDEEFADTLGNNGKRAASEMFNWSNEEKLLLNFYEELLVV